MKALRRFVLSESAYAKVRHLSTKFCLHTELQSQLNRFVMTALFFIPTTMIALYESFSVKQKWLNELMNGTPLEDEDSPLARDPDVGGEDAANGLVISRVPFAELVKEFPNIHEVSYLSMFNCPREHIVLQSSETCIIKEIHQVKAQLDALTKRLDGKVL
jgi:hypothetical protein